MAAGVKNKEKKYVFDVAFDGESDNESVYRSTVQTLIPGVLRGLNATVFAYGEGEFWQFQFSEKFRKTITKI